MGQSESSQNLSENNDLEAKPQHEAAISVTYGPNIIGKIFGYDENAEILAKAANNIYQQIKRPKSTNIERAKEILDDVHIDGMRVGQASVNLGEFERDLMDDIKYRILKQQRKYGIETIEQAKESFDMIDKERICDEMKQNVARCFELNSGNNRQNNTSKNGQGMPYFDARFSSLNCATEMDRYLDCVARRGRSLYA